MALTASVVATGAVAAGLAYSEGAWGAPTSTTAIATDTIPDSATDTTPDSTPDSIPDSAPTSTSASSTTVAPTSSTAEATAPVETTQTPETTPAAETPVEPSAFADGEFLGTAEYTEWGDVQVTVTISDGAIVDIEAVQYPTGRKSTDINSEAVPLLEANAIAIQGTDVDIVSGATYTSQTYADSLQAALDEAALAAAQEAATS